MTLRDVALLLSKADYSPEGAIYYNPNDLWWLSRVLLCSQNGARGKLAGISICYETRQYFVPSMEKTSRLGIKHREKKTRIPCLHFY